MGSVDYTIQRGSGSADFEYKNPDDSACARFYDTIKKQENCTFAQLFFGVGSTKKYMGETVYRKHVRQVLIVSAPKPQPEPPRQPKPKKVFSAKRNWDEFVAKKKEKAAEKSNGVMIERVNKLRDAFYNCDSFNRQQAEDAIGMKTNTLKTLLQYMRGQGVIEMKKSRRSAEYRFVKQV